MKDLQKYLAQLTMVQMFWMVVVATFGSILIAELLKDNTEYEYIYEDGVYSVEPKENALRSQMLKSDMMVQSFVPEAMPARVASKVAARRAGGVAEDVVSTQRRVQETHNIEMLGPNEQVKSLYEFANNACDPAFCEVSNGSLYQSGQQNVGTLAIKIDHDKFETYLNGISEQSQSVRIVSKSRTANDRTAEYADLDARKKAQEALRTRLIGLVEAYDGDDIDALLSVERELARVQGQIESMEARLRSIRYVTDRTTLNLTIRGEVAYAPRPSESAITKAFNNFWLIIESNIAKMITMFAGLVTWILLGLVGYLGYRVYRRFSGE